MRVANNYQANSSLSHFAGIGSYSNDTLGWTMRRRIMAVLRKATAVLGMGQKARIGRLGGSAATIAMLMVFGSNPAYAQLALGNGVASGGASIAISDGGGGGQPAQATSAGAIAIGRGAIADGGTDGIAIGSLSHATSVAVGVGYNANASGYGATAIGRDTVSSGFGSVSNGYGAKSYGNNAVAIGVGATASNANDLYLGNAAGTGATVSGSNSGNVGIGAGSGQTVNGSNNASFGTNAGRNVTGSSNLAMGLAAGTGVTGSNNVATGISAGSTVTGNFNSAQGPYAGQSVSTNYNLAQGWLAGNNVSVGDSNTAIGNSSGSTVAGSSNVGIGVSAGINVTGNNNIANGFQAGQYVTGSNNIALGRRAGNGTSSAALTVSDTIALGNGSLASANNGVAIGKSSTASGLNAMALGSGASSTAGSGVALGYNASASGSTYDAAVAIGGRSSSTGDGAVAIGGTATGAAASGATASGAGAIAIGGYGSGSARATSDGAIAVGRTSNVSGNGGVGIGQFATVNSFGGSAIGYGTHANGASATAVGFSATAEESAFAGGSEAKAWSSSSVAIGNGASTNYTATWEYDEDTGLPIYDKADIGSVAIGLNAKADNYDPSTDGTGSGSAGAGIAIGENAQALTSNYSIAMGRNALAQSADYAGTAIAIGQSAQATGTNSTAFGTSSEANAAGAMAMGTESSAAGSECELFSGTPSGEKTTHWYVDWTAFEGSGKIIGDVVAVLETETQPLKQLYETFGLNSVLPEKGPARDGEEGKPISFENGTAIRIGLLHDNWDARDSLRLKETLEALLPPHDQGDFDIFVLDHRARDDSGFIENFPPDQFDYKLIANVGADGSISLTLDRREIDVSHIRPRVFQLKTMSKHPFSKADFEAGTVTYGTTLAKLTGATGETLKDYLAIGPFSLTLYFFKLTNPTADNLLRFPQKNFDVGKRRRWLKTSGGIRLYRDNFRVRPYGEPGSTTYDWLLLGERVARNPAAASRVGWRVPPNQVAGTLHISKEENPQLADQSSREGVMNERALDAFRAIIVSLIKEFEYDRSYILSQFNAAYNLDNKEEKEAEEGRRIAEEILGQSEEIEESSENDTPAPSGNQTDLFPPSNQEDEQKSEESDVALRQVSQAYSSEVRKNESLRDDIQVMRGMATLGTVLVSFTHELKQIKTNIDSRSRRLSDAIESVVDQQKLDALRPAHSPFRMLERLRKQDEKVARWVKFALSAVSFSNLARSARLSLGQTSTKRMSMRSACVRRNDKL